MNYCSITDKKSQYVPLIRNISSQTFGVLSHILRASAAV